MSVREVVMPITNSVSVMVQGGGIVQREQAAMADDLIAFIEKEKYWN